MIGHLLLWALWVFIVAATVARGLDSWRDSTMVLNRMVWDPWAMAFELALWATINIGTLAFVLRGHP